jgi:hypothetical protein
VADPHPLTLINSSYGKNEFLGQISYSQNWTDDNTFSGNSPIKKIDLSINDTLPTHLTQSYQVINYKEIIQPQKQSTQGNRSVTVNLIGKRGTELNTYIQESKRVITGYGLNLITGSHTNADGYISSVDYSLNEYDNTFNFNIGFAFFGKYKAFEDTTFGDILI